MRPMIDKDRMFVYGFDVGMGTTAELKQKVVASGSGTIKVVYTDYGLGTGAKINVLSDNTVVKSYTIIIFGDVNGDAVIDTNDSSDVLSAASGLKDYEDDCIIMAADLNGDSSVDTMDSGIIFSVASAIIDLDQVNPY